MKVEGEKLFYLTSCPILRLFDHFKKSKGMEAWVCMWNQF